MATMQEMVEAVKSNALNHDNEGGWDSIVECYEDSDIANEIEGCTTIEEAIYEVGKGCEIWGDYRRAYAKKRSE